MDGELWLETGSPWEDEENQIDIADISELDRGFTLCEECCLEECSSECEGGWENIDV